MLIHIKSDFVDPETLAHALYALMPANRLVCRLCLCSGIRIGDAVALRTAELKESFTIIEAKTGKKKRIKLPQPLLRELREQAGEIYVFEHRTDPMKHRTRQAVYADLKRAAKAFRLDENLTPHTLRKMYAVSLYRSTGDLQKVRKALNHDNEAVTMLYALADMLSGKKKRHP